MGARGIRSTIVPLARMCDEGLGGPVDKARALELYALVGCKQYGKASIQDKDIHHAAIPLSCGEYVDEHRGETRHRCAIRSLAHDSVVNLTSWKTARSMPLIFWINLSIVLVGVYLSFSSFYISLARRP